MIHFSFPDDCRILGIGVHAFDRLGLEDMLPQYNIVCMEEDKGIKEAQTNIPITALTSINPEPSFARKGLVKMMSSPELRSVISSYRNQYKTIYGLVYKSTADIESAAKDLQITLLANPSRLRQPLENKVEFRNTFASQIPVPKYSIHQIEALPGKYKELRDAAVPLVIQDELLSGGRGTYVIHNQREYAEAVKKLSFSKERRVVVSDYIAGEDVSMLGCATRYGVFTGPLQEQLIADPLLVNPNFPLSKLFCGGRWGNEEHSDETAAQARFLTQHIGEQLYAQGYRGIFGLDFRLSKEGALYVIEINPRLTGLTPITTFIQNKTFRQSLLLLHVLELANVPYTINSTSALQKKLELSSKLTYAILYNKQETACSISPELRPGIYTITPRSISFSRPGYRLEDITNNEQVLVCNMSTRRLIFQPGEEIVRIVTPSMHWRTMIPFIEHYLEASSASPKEIPLTFRE